MNEAVKAEILVYAEGLPTTKGAQADYMDLKPVRRLLNHLKAHPDSEAEARLSEVISTLYRLGADIRPGSKLLRMLGDLVSYRDDDPELVWRRKAEAEGEALLRSIESFVRDCRKDLAIEAVDELGRKYPEFASQTSFAANRDAIATLEPGNNLNAVMAVMDLSEAFHHYVMGYGEES